MAILRKNRKNSGPSEAKRTSKGKIATEIGAGLAAAGAAAAAGYYLYGSKNAKKHRKTVAKEIKKNWKIVQSEVQKAGRASASRAKVVGKRALTRGKKTIKKIVKKVSAKRKGR